MKSNVCATREVRGRLGSVDFWFRWERRPRYARSFSVIGLVAISILTHCLRHLGHFVLIHRIPALALSGLNLFVTFP
jgi:hypothetical protein